MSDEVLQPQKKREESTKQSTVQHSTRNIAVDVLVTYNGRRGEES